MRILLFLLLFSSRLCFAQTDSRYTIGTLDTIHSRVLNEDRLVLIYVPEGYDTAKQYPVVYLLDGENFFHSFTGVVQHLSASFIVPEMIVVGVVNTNRGLNFTPTAVPESYPKPNGGGELFTRFMEKELVPFVEGKFRTAPYRMLVGHSLGGLLSANILLHHTALFNAYILIDPSMWWDKMKLNTQVSGLSGDGRFMSKRMFLAISNSVPAGMKDTIQAMKDTTNATIGLRSIIQFRDVLSRQKNKDLRWANKYYEHENHASMPLISFYDGLRSIFDFYKRPSLAVLTDKTPEILEDHYKMLSRQMGYTILPAEHDLSGLAWRSKVLENNRDRALVFLQMYVRLYPASQRANYELGQHYQEQGDSKMAQEYLKRAEKFGR